MVYESSAELAARLTELKRRISGIESYADTGGMPHPNERAHLATLKAQRDSIARKLAGRSK
jgi:hypothetical protein